MLEIDERQEPAPRLIKAQKLPLDEFPSEKSVVSRIVKSVVAALPSAIRKAVDKTGQHILPSHKRDKSQQIKLDNNEERPQSSGVDARAWREMRTSPIFDGLPNEALRDALMSGDAHVLRLVRDSLVPMDGSIALVRSGQVAIARFSEEALAAERKAAHAARAGGQEGRRRLDKKERKRRNEVGPLIRVAEQNLATFEDGDVVETAVGAANHATSPATRRRRRWSSPSSAGASTCGSASIRSWPTASAAPRRRRAPRSKPPTAPSPRSPTSSSATACRCR